MGKSTQRTFHKGTWKRVSIPGGNVSTGTFSISGMENLLISSGNRWPPKAGSKRDIGGPFLCVKNDYQESTSIPEVIYNAYPVSSASTAYYGPQFAKDSVVNRTGAPWPIVNVPSDASMNALGATLISRVLPTNPNAGLATFVGELKSDGLPKFIGSDVFKSKVLTAKKAGSNYLNLEFGWKPLIRDLLKFADSVRNADKILAQYERNSGRGVRRRISLPTTHVESQLSSSGLAYPSPAQTTAFYGGTSGRGTITSMRNVSQRKWFSGSFTYYLDTGQDARSKIHRFTQEANKLFGVRLTPEVVWDLAPWSWAADWVGNAGDVFHNISAFASDGLVMQYGYVMHEVKASDTYTLSNVWITSSQARHSCSQTFTTTVKKRLQATPFGFGLNPSVDFTGRQWAIVGALGLSRSGNQL